MIKLILLNFFTKFYLIKNILNLFLLFKSLINISNIKKIINNSSPSFIYKKIKDLVIANTNNHIIKNIKHDLSKENILFFMHQNNVDGTTLLSITLLQELKKQYNVYAVTLSKGKLSHLISENTVQNLSKLEFIFLSFLLPKFKFSILNSLETYSFLGYTKKKSINSIILAHEYISLYEKHILDFIKFNSDHIIFSSKKLINIDNFVIPQIKNDISFFPQCVISYKLPSNKIKLNFNFKNKIIITTIGTQCIRKGYDLFLDIASTLDKENFLFIWVGNKATHEIPFLKIFNEKIKINKITNVLIYDNIGDLDILYQNSDAILSTSRLDPFPNIFFDAVNKNKPYFLFNDSSGVCELFDEFSLLNLLSSKYTSSYELSKTILNYFKNISKNKKILESKYKLIKEKYFISSKSYLSKLHEINNKITNLKLDLISQKNYLESNNIIDHFFSKRNDVPEYWFVKRKIEKNDKYFGWSKGYYNKKVKPGFHQGIYRELNNLDGMMLPIFDYVKKNEPQGKWITNLIDNHYKESISIESLKVAMHIHVFYPELLEEILKKIRINKKLPDIYISTDSTSKLSLIKKIISKFRYNGSIKFIKSKNVGRDLSPFLIFFKHKLSQYDIIGHFHTKKSPHISNHVSSSWRNFLLSNLIGYKNYSMMDKILSYFLNNPETGIAYPDDPNEIGWTQNYNKASKLLLKMKVNDIPLNFNFPVGTMFWARPDAIRQIFNLYDDYSDFDPEPIGIDGSDLHAIERILGIIPDFNNYKTLLIHNRNIRR